MLPEVSVGWIMTTVVELAISYVYEIKICDSLCASCAVVVGDKALHAGRRARAEAWSQARCTFPKPEEEHSRNIRISNADGISAGTVALAV
jgi:hypothetical protein